MAERGQLRDSFNEAPAFLPGNSSRCGPSRLPAPRFNEAPAFLPGNRSMGTVPDVIAVSCFNEAPAFLPGNSVAAADRAEWETLALQ